MLFKSVNKPFKPFFKSLFTSLIPFDHADDIFSKPPLISFKSPVKAPLITEPIPANKSAVFLAKDLKTSHAVFRIFDTTAKVFLNMVAISATPALTTILSLYNSLNQFIEL